MENLYEPVKSEMHELDADIQYERFRKDEEADGYQYFHIWLWRGVKYCNKRCFEIWVRFAHNGAAIQDIVSAHTLLLIHMSFHGNGHSTSATEHLKEMFK